MRNADETDIDCGGSCPVCEPGLACAEPLDCDSAVCSENICLEPACDDEVRNGDETDVDCGGSCAPCASTRNEAPADCQTGVCGDGLCLAVTCADGVQNGDETAIDCGGTCAGCADIARIQAADCLSGHRQLYAPCPPVDARNGTETDVVVAVGVTRAPMLRAAGWPLIVRVGCARLTSALRRPATMACVMVLRPILIAVVHASLAQRSAVVWCPMIARAVCVSTTSARRRGAAMESPTAKKSATTRTRSMAMAVPTGAPLPVAAMASCATVLRSATMATTSTPTTAETTARLRAAAMGWCTRASKNATTRTTYKPTSAPTPVPLPAAAMASSAAVLKSATMPTMSMAMPVPMRVPPPAVAMALSVGQGSGNGNDINTDACLNGCIVAACGDGIVQAGVEGCDDGNTTTEECAGIEACTVCAADCTEQAGDTDVCGDGVVDAEEGCDDGNTTTEECPA